MSKQDKPSRWRVKILTLFPDAFPGPLAESITGKALARELWSIDTVNIRDYATDKHRQVDDSPAGGGPGMVIRADIAARAIDATLNGEYADPARFPRLYMSARGRRFDQNFARKLAAAEGAVILCGHYEGVDQRVIEARKFDEISLGDYIVTGGDIAAMVVIDAAIRLRKGVLGSSASSAEESHNDGLLEYPQFTRPRIWDGKKIPQPLLSGNHARIREWRRRQAEETTKLRRPDLWRLYVNKNDMQD